MNLPRGRFLIAMLDLGGTVPANLSVAAELVRRGHQVRILADPTVRAGAEAAGCEFSPWREAPHFKSREDQTAIIAGFESRNPYRALTAMRTFTGHGMIRRQAREVISAAHDYAVDAILADVMPGLLVGALASGVPTAAVIPSIYLPPTAGHPMFGTGWTPGDSLITRARDWLVPTAARSLLAPAVPYLNAVLTSYGQQPLRRFFELFDRCARVLVLTSPSFDFRVPQLPDNVRYVGPRLDDPDWATEVSWRRTGNEPLVLVATSSVYQRQQVDLLRRVAEALGRLPVRAVLTTGRAVAADQVHAPSNVQVMQAAPHRQVLAEASAVITHAGHGSVLKTLAAGVPLVCMPMGRDQKDNTVRVLRLGAGVRISKSSKPDRIAAALAQVLAEPAFASAARRFADVLEREAATQPSAADEAERLLDQPYLKR